MTKPLSVAIISPGDRVDKITTPLETTNLDYQVNPKSTRGFDVLLIDTPNRNMFKHTALGKLRGQTVLYRARGDPFWGLKYWIDSKVKRWLAIEMLKWVDGCIAIAPHQANKYERKTGVPTKIVSLPKNPDEWPTVIHRKNELRIVTLTNAVYPDKIQPLIEAAPFVDDVLQETGGYWRIGSWSTGYEDRINDAVSSLANVHYERKLNGNEELARANAMIHLSNFDAMPNALLEGFASNVPVITNDHPAFTGNGAPNIVVDSHDELRASLLQLTNPELRANIGQQGMEYINQNHLPNQIGQKYKQAICEFYS